ncbi:hypothetical protein B0H10DRAFT_2218548 [Mycena sp. CBHHK59/15]|nr:hypothetical protein B0H10DRAFT_2218548 [Mycena sp. CBHHK59/15]
MATASPAPSLRALAHTGSRLLSVSTWLPDLAQIDPARASPEWARPRPSGGFPAAQPASPLLLETCGVPTLVFRERDAALGGGMGIGHGGARRTLQAPASLLGRGPVAKRRGGGVMVVARQAGSSRVARSCVPHVALSAIELGIWCSVRAGEQRKRFASSPLLACGGSIAQSHPKMPARRSTSAPRTSRALVSAAPASAAPALFSVGRSIRAPSPIRVALHTPTPSRCRRRPSSRAGHCASVASLPVPHPEPGARCTSASSECRCDLVRIRRVPSVIERTNTRSASAMSSARGRITGKWNIGCGADRASAHTLRFTIHLTSTSSARTASCDTQRNAFVRRRLWVARMRWTNG